MSGVHENGQVDEAKVAEREDGSEEVRVHKTAARPSTAGQPARTIDRRIDQGEE